MIAGFVSGNRMTRMAALFAIQITTILFVDQNLLFLWTTRFLRL